MQGKLIIDGYNLINADEDLRLLAGKDLEVARNRLIREIIEYSTRASRQVQLVFDAGRREGPSNSEDLSEFLTVTFTAYGETADTYIEKLAYSIGERDRGEVIVVTGDYLQQRITSGAGLLRMSAREFMLEMRDASERARKEADAGEAKRWRVTLEERMPDDVKAALERIRDRRE